jgi:hypothetical protein
MSGSHDTSGNHTDIDDHGHDQYTVPPFVETDSLHDRILSFLSLVTLISLCWCIGYWLTLPLASVETEVRTVPANSTDAAKTAP